MKRNALIKLFSLVMISTITFGCSNEDSEPVAENIVEIVEQVSQANIAGKEVDQKIRMKLTFSPEGDLLHDEIISVELANHTLTQSHPGQWGFQSTSLGNGEEIVQSRGLSIAEEECDPAITTRQTVYAPLQGLFPGSLIRVPVACITTTTQSCFEGGWNSNGDFVGRITFSSSSRTSLGGCS